MQENNKPVKKKRHKITKTIVLTVIICFVFAIGYVAYMQKDNINALKYATSYSEQEIESKLIENNDILNEEIRKISDIEYEELSEKDRENLKNGTLTAEDAVEIIAQKSFNKTEVNNEHNQLSEPDKAENIQLSNVEGLLAQIYVAKAEFLNSIDSLVSQVKSEWTSLDSSEKTTARKKDMISKYTSIGKNLENQCDANMETLLAQLEAELAKTGGDMSIATTIRNTYTEEKSLRKAELISKYF